MRTIRASDEELVIRSSSMIARIIGTIFCALATGLCVVGGSAVRSDVIGSLFIFGFAALIGLPGIVAWWRAKDADYHFRIKERRLVVQCRRGETVVPFSMIVKAEVSVSACSDGPDSYGLQLILKDEVRQLADGARVITQSSGLLWWHHPTVIEMTEVLCSGEKTLLTYTALSNQMNEALVQSVIAHEDRGRASVSLSS